jgi:hypothetical protein
MVGAAREVFPLAESAGAVPRWSWEGQVSTR